MCPSAMADPSFLKNRDKDSKKLQFIPNVVQSHTWLPQILRLVFLLIALSLLPEHINSHQGEILSANLKLKKKVAVSGSRCRLKAGKIKE